MEYDNVIRVCPGCGGEALSMGSTGGSRRVGETLKLHYECKVCDLTFDIELNPDALKMSIAKYREKG